MARLAPVLALLLSACSSSTTSSPEVSGEQSPGIEGAPGPRTSASVDQGSSAPAKEAAWTGVSMNDVPPPGTQPLSEAEAEQLGKDCKAFVDAVAGKNRKKPANDPTRLGIAEAVLDVLQDPPRVAGVDVKLCADLLRRDTVSYLARMREVQAAMALKIILSRVDQNHQDKKAPCPSAPPIPAEVDAIKTGLYESKRSEYQAGGWACLGYDSLGAPQRHQLEVWTEGPRYRIIARSFPAGALSELFIEGTLIPGTAVDLGAEIMRRSAK